jgi:hypothetical protein
MQENIFYVVQPMPGDAPWHLKLGYSENMESRLGTYQTLCPDAIILKSWPCAGYSTEAEAIAYVEHVGFERIGPEVFSCLHPERLIACLDNFFGVALPREIKDLQRDVSATRRDYRAGHPSPEDEAYISRKALAAKLGITLGAVEKLIKSGQLPGYVSANAQSSATPVYVKLSDVEAYLARQAS